jgi:kynurenine formamidase
MLIDLSVPINEQTPVYPGDPATKIAKAGTHSESGYQDHYVSMGTHVGTHIDAPAHMIEGGKNLSEYPIERFQGRGHLITDFLAVKSVDLQEGDIVLFHTGLYHAYHEPRYFTDYPAMSEEVAQYLIEKKVGMVGVDTCSVDSKEGFPIHKLLLGAEILIIENLTNLEPLTGKEFRVHAYPLKLEIDGAPARVVAELV